MKFYTFEEVAKTVGITLRTFQRWRAQGRGPSVIELGPRTKRVGDAELEEWAKSCRRAAPGEKVT
jgi:excisionase family DNA binding protein